MSDVRKSRSTLSRPQLARTLQFNSLQAQKVIDRSFERLKYALFSTSVILRIISDDEEEIARIDGYINEQFAMVEGELTMAKAQLEKILASNGIGELARYSNPETRTVEVDSPRAGVFLKLVSLLDDLILLIDTAWLCGEFNDIQKKDATYQWQQRLIRLAGRIVAIERRARAAAFNKGKADEVQAQAPADTGETDAEITAAAEEVQDIVEDATIPTLARN